MGIMPKESRLVSEEEDDNDETMAEGVDRDNEGVCMDGEDDPPDDLRYNGEGKENCCINWEHAEDSFEARNCDTSKIRSQSLNTIVLSTTHAKPIDLSQTAHLQLRALNLRHKLDVHS